MIFQLNIIGVSCIVLSLIHLAFPAYFNWKQELSVVSLINRQLMYVHTFFVALVVFLMGLLCLTSSTALIETQLGNRFAFGLFVFWGLRLLVQFFIYSPKLWRGKRKETTIHVLFSLLWAYFSSVFFIVYWSGQRG